MAHGKVLEGSVPRETMLCLIYIAGFIKRNNDQEEEYDGTKLYYEKFPDYFDALNNGNLKVPRDNIVSGDPKVEN